MLLHLPLQRRVPAPPLSYVVPYLPRIYSSKNPNLPGPFFLHNSGIKLTIVINYNRSRWSVKGLGEIAALYPTQTSLENCPQVVCLSKETLYNRLRAGAVQLLAKERQPSMIPVFLVSGISLLRNLIALILEAGSDTEVVGRAAAVTSSSPPVRYTPSL